ncbi:MAG: phosphate acyltransferase PlsX [Treponema sp.]|nr:phosphate acyltransferase PlsX [Treponema sp.]
MYTVVIDTLGSDKGPETIVQGACEALKEFSNLKVCFTGDEKVVEGAVEKFGGDKKRVEIIHASDVITNYDHPVMAIKEKTNSSLVKALEELKKNDECIGLINAGSTGALLVGSTLYLKKPDMMRPALAAVLPAEKGNFTCVVDTGANIDCTSDILVQFAHLGSELMHDLYKIEKPRIGLLSNGAEESKGNALVKETHQLLKKEEGINFVGNFEGTNCLSGDCDVLVCDGFAGNQVLKVSEGMARRLIGDIVKIGKSTGNSEALKIAEQLIAKYDFNSLGGGIVLGITKYVIKAHGAANEKSILNTVRMLVNLAENKDIY